MELEAAKMIGAGLAVIALAGVGVGIGNIFSSLVSSIARNPAARGEVFELRGIQGAACGALPRRRGARRHEKTYPVQHWPSGKCPRSQDNRGYYERTVKEGVSHVRSPEGLGSVAHIPRVQMRPLIRQTNNQ